MLNEVFYRSDVLTVPANRLTSVNTIAGNPVQSGDAVLYGDLAGVATTSAGALASQSGYVTSTTSAGALAVKFKGTFNLPVTPAAAMLPGARVYFDPATGVLSDNSAKTHFGWYLPSADITLNAGAATVAPVKLKH